MDADAQNSISAASQNPQQLTAPPGWTKKLVPAKGRNVTLRKHDVVFVAPDGQEIPSQWHLRRYLKAHPEGPAFSDFDWSSGEESIRRSARVSTKEVNVTETPLTKRKAKRNALEMEVEGAEEDKVKKPARKRAKKSDKPADTAGASAVKEKTVLPDKDEVMHEALGESAVSGKPDDKEAAPVADLAKEVDAEKTVMPAVTDDQKGGADAEKVLDETGKAQAEAEDKPSIFVGTDIVREEEPKVVEVEQVVQAKEQGSEVKTTDKEPQPESEPNGLSEVILDDELKGEKPVVESEKPLEPVGETVIESKDPSDQTPEAREDEHKVTTETHDSEERQDAEKKSLEPLMQKEEHERLHGANSPLKVEHMKEKSPNELSSSPVPLSVGNQ